MAARDVNPLVKAADCYESIDVPNFEILKQVFPSALVLAGCESAGLPTQVPEENRSCLDLSQSFAVIRRFNISLPTIDKGKRGRFGTCKQQLQSWKFVGSTADHSPSLEQKHFDTLIISRPIFINPPH